MASVGSQKQSDKRTMSRLSIRSLRQAVRCRFGPPIQSLAHATGLMPLTARMCGVRGAVILMYHSVADGDAVRFIDPRNHITLDVFEQQIAILARDRTVVSLTDLVTMLRRGESPENGMIVVTFDDGYRDTMTAAAPILSHYGLPATVFLPTAYIELAEPQWVDEAYSIFQHRTRRRIQWSGVSGELRFDLDNQASQRAGYQAIVASLLSASHSCRRKMLDELRNQLRPCVEPPSLTMTWEDVRTLNATYSNIEFGGHTVEHTDLTSVHRERAYVELSGCMQSIARRIGHRPRHFSFPYGRSSCGLRTAVAEVGFLSACGAAGEAVIGKTTDPFALPRIAAPSNMKRFHVLTNGANTGLWRKLGQ